MLIYCRVLRDLEYMTHDNGFDYLFHSLLDKTAIYGSVSLSSRIKLFVFYQELGLGCGSIRGSRWQQVLTSI